MADQLGGLSAKDLRELREELTGFQSDLSASMAAVTALGKDSIEGINNNFSKSKNALQSLANMTTEQLKSEKAQKEVAEKLKKIRQEQLQSETNILILQKQLSTATGKQATDIAKALQHEVRRKDALDRSVASANKLVDAVKKIADAGEGFDNVSTFLEKIPIIGGKLGVISTPFKQAGEAARKATADGLTPMEARAAGINKLSGLISITFGTMILGAVMESAKQVGNINKQLGIGLDGSRKVRDNFIAISEAANDSRINVSKLSKANEDINKALGTSVQLSGESLKTYIKNTEYLGASGEAAAKLEQLSINLGTSSEAYSANLAGALNASGKTLGVHVPLARAMEVIKGMSATTLMNLENNPKALANAVAMSEKLGMSFQQLRSTADKLLNFEDSISSELEAELLTGKELNLERARAAALTGNDVELMRELSTQVGTLNDFTKMNVIQRESLAQAFGMTADQMGDMLYKQDMINKLGDKAREASVEQLRNAEEIRKQKGGTLDDALLEVQRQVDVSKRFEDIVAKLREAFVNFFNKLESTGMLDRVADFADMIATSPITKFVMGWGATGATALFAATKAVSMLRGTAALPMVVTMAGQGMSGAAGGMGALFNGTAFGKNRISADATSPTGYRDASGKFASKQAGANAVRGRQMGRIGGAAGIGMMVGGLMQNSENETMQAAGGFISGASSGAMMGMMFGPIGAGIGAAIGGGMSLLTSYLEKKDKEAAELKEREERKKADEQDYYKKLYDTLERQANAKTQIYMDTVVVGNTIQQYSPQIQ